MHCLGSSFIPSCRADSPNNSPATAAKAERNRQAQQLNFLQTYKALTDGGVPPQEAQAAISNPSLMRTLAVKYLGPRSPGNASSAPAAPASAPGRAAECPERCRLLPEPDARERRE